MSRHSWVKTPFKADALREVALYLRQIADGETTDYKREHGLCFNIRRKFMDNSQQHNISFEIDRFFREKGLHPVFPIEDGNQRFHVETKDKYDAKTHFGWERLCLARQLSARLIAVACELEQTRPAKFAPCFVVCKDGVRVGSELVFLKCGERVDGL